MMRVTRNGLQLWQFESLAGLSGIDHFVSGRNADGTDDFSLSLSSSPDKERIRQNRATLAAAMHVETDRLVFPSQVHKTRVVRVTPNTRKDELLETDALITNEPGVCISVMSADCVPILVYDRTHGAVAAIHAGWRGTVAGILAVTLKEMQRVFGTAPGDVVAGIGPSVSCASYEVGEEVVEAVVSTFGQESNQIIDRRGTKAKVDLWKANELQLRSFGTPANAIETAGLCTVINNREFFSARKGDSGRFAAGIMLRP